MRVNFNSKISIIRVAVSNVSQFEYVAGSTRYDISKWVRGMIQFIQFRLKECKDYISTKYSQSCLPILFFGNGGVIAETPLPIRGWQGLWDLLICALTGCTPLAPSSSKKGEGESTGTYVRTFWCTVYLYIYIYTVDPTFKFIYINTGCKEMILTIFSQLFFQLLGLIGAYKSYLIQLNTFLF